MWSLPYGIWGLLTLCYFFLSSKEIELHLQDGGLDVILLSGKFMEARREAGWAAYQACLE